MENLPLGRTAALIPEFAVKHLPLGRTLIYVIMIMSILPKGRSFTANSGTKAAVLLKGRSSTAISGTQAAVLLGIYRVIKITLQRFRDDRGGKNKHVFYLTKLWHMHRFAARWSYG